MHSWWIKVIVKIIYNVKKVCQVKLLFQINAVLLNSVYRIILKLYYSFHKNITPCNLNVNNKKCYPRTNFQISEGSWEIEE